jgi:hypothetical protein
MAGSSSDGPLLGFAMSEPLPSALVVAKPAPCKQLLAPQDFIRVLVGCVPGGGRQFYLQNRYTLEAVPLDGDQSEIEALSWSCIVVVSLGLDVHKFRWPDPPTNRLSVLTAVGHSCNFVAFVAGQQRLGHYTHVLAPALATRCVLAHSFGRRRLRFSSDRHGVP